MVTKHPAAMMSQALMKSFAMPIAKAIGPDPCMMFIKSLAYSPNIPFMGGKQYCEIASDFYCGMPVSYQIKSLLDVALSPFSV